MKRQLAGSASSWMAFAMAVAAVACTGNKEEKATLPEKSAAAEKAPAAAQAPAAAVAPAPASEAPQAEPRIETEGSEVVAPAAQPQPTSGAIQSRLTGQVTSQRASKIAFQVTGFIAQTIAKPGTVVKKGEVLATLEDEDFDLRLQLAQAKREQAKIALETAKSDFEREQELKKQNASTSAMFERVQASYDQARLNYKLAGLEALNAERALADTKLKAPYDCVVVTQEKFDGEYVQTSNPVFGVYDLTNPEITFEAPERMLGQVQIGDTLKVQIPSSGYAGQAEIVRMVPVVTEKTRTFRIIAKPSQGGDKVVPGLFAEATIN